MIACGAFSKKLTDNLGEKIPLDTERGYHVHFKNCDHLLSRPVIFSNRGFGITPMEQGLRVVGTVEFGGLDNPLSKSRVKNLINNAKYMLGDLPEHEDEWLGFRPSLPDFLPVMGPSKNHKNVFYCFGHHHLGWTLGPISGKIISGMIANENTNLRFKTIQLTKIFLKNYLLSTTTIVKSSFCIYLELRTLSMISFNLSLFGLSLYLVI